MKVTPATVLPCGCRGTDLQFTDSEGQPLERVQVWNSVSGHARAPARDSQGRVRTKCYCGMWRPEMRKLTDVTAKCAHGTVTLP